MIKEQSEVLYRLEDLHFSIQNQKSIDEIFILNILINERIKLMNFYINSINNIIVNNYKDKLDISDINRKNVHEFYIDMLKKDIIKEQNKLLILSLMK